MNLTNYVKSFDQSDLSALIQADAQDTTDKLSQAMEWIAYTLQFDANDSDIVAGEKFYSTFSDYDVTIVLQDGRVLQLQYNPEEQYIASVYSEGGQTFNGYIWQGGTWLDSVDALYLLDGSDTTPEVILASLTAQQQASIVMARLAALCRADSVDITTILASLSDMDSYYTSDVADFLTALMDLGPALNPSTLLASLTRVYVPYGTATASESKIEFNDTKYGLKSFYGTCIKGALLTGAQILSTVFMVTGGVIGAIIGAVGSAVAYGWQTLTTTGALSTEAKLDVGANHYEFAQPVCQRTAPVSSVSSEVMDLITTHGVIAVKLPSITFYLWQSAELIYAEGYLTAGQRAFPNGEEQLLSPRFLIFQGSDFNADDAPPPSQVISYYASYDAGVSQAYDPNNTQARFFCPFSPVTRWTSSDISDSQGNKYFNPTMGQVTDGDIRNRVWSAAITTYWAIKNVEYAYGRLDWDPDSVDPQIRVGTVTWNGALDFDFSDRVIKALYFYNDSTRPQAERIPTWSELTNEVCPTIMELFSSMSVQDFVKFISVDSPTVSKAYTPTYLQAYVRPVDSFRNSFTITPPDFDRTELLTSIIVSAVTVAAVAGVATVSVALAKKAIRSAAARRQAKADEAYYAYIDPTSESYQNKQVLSSYLKNSRKAERLSGLLGGSGFVSATIDNSGTNLDAALGSVVTTEVVTELLDGDLNGAIDAITGANDSGGEPIELSTIVRLIKGSV